MCDKAPNYTDKKCNTLFSCTLIEISLFFFYTKLMSLKTLRHGFGDRVVACLLTKSQR